MGNSLRFAALVAGILGTTTGLAPVMDGTKELRFVQIIWRHGDRSPTDTFPTDPFQEDAWTFGGGGWGQLSPLGMQQHLRLGKRLRDRYIDSTYKFLPPVFDSKAMFVRSTGLNRTIISAMSNMLGMYGQKGYGATAGSDYPDEPGWPTGFVPIAPHSVDYDTDYVGNMDCVCQRRDWLWSMAQQSKEFTDWASSPPVANLMANLTLWCNKSYPFEDLWIVADSLLIEQIYMNDSLRKQNKWFTDDIYQQIVDVNEQSYLYQYGIFNKPVLMNGLDVGHEMQVIRAGSLMNDMAMYFALKSDCASGRKADGCDWINRLRYYVYSAHDETLYSLLVALGIELLAISPHGYPLYSAAGVVEYWFDTVDKKDYFKLMYHHSDGDGFTPLTSSIAGCDVNSDFCDFEVFRAAAQRLRPPQAMSEWCNVDPRKSSALRRQFGFVVQLAAFLVAIFNSGILQYS